MLRPGCLLCPLCLVTDVVLNCFCAFTGFGKEKEKEKKLEEDSSGVNPPQSAFLGPTLWDKTLPYDGDNFQLEYMDLEEFLSENGIPGNAQRDQSQQQQQQQQQTLSQQTAPSTPSSPSVVDLSNRAAPSGHTGMVPQNCLQSPPRSGNPPPPSVFYSQPFPLSRPLICA